MGALLMHDFLAQDTVPARQIDRQFEANPQLPGVIVLRGDRIAGMVSRQRFHQRVSRRFGYEVYLNRPLGVLLESVNDIPMVLAAECKIYNAAHRAINRSKETIAEPIVVICADGRPRLLDTHLLLLAHSRIFAMVAHMVHQQRQILKQSVSGLKQAQLEAAETNRLLEIRTIALRDYNQLLEQQQAELVEKNGKIAALNWKLVQVSRFLSTEGRRVLSETLSGVDSIADNTQKIINISQDLSSELNTVHEISIVIKEVSNQAKHLALQVSILAHHSRIRLGGISRAASDISVLSGQTFLAGQRMDSIARKIQERIQVLGKLANQEADVAQSLMRRFERTQAAIDALAELMEGKDKMLGKSGDQYFGKTDEISLLRKRLSQAKSAVLELESAIARKA